MQSQIEAYDTLEDGVHRPNGRIEEKKEGKEPVISQFSQGIEFHSIEGRQLNISPLEVERAQI